LLALVVVAGLVDFPTTEAAAQKIPVLGYMANENVNPERLAIFKKGCGAVAGLIMTVIPLPGSSEVGHALVRLLLLFVYWMRGVRFSEPTPLTKPRQPLVRDDADEVCEAALALAAALLDGDEAKRLASLSAFCTTVRQVPAMACRPRRDSPRRGQLFLPNCQREHCLRLSQFRVPLLPPVSTLGPLSSTTATTFFVANARIYLVHFSTDFVAATSGGGTVSQVAMLINGVPGGRTWRGTTAGDVLIQVAANTTVQFFNGSYNLIEPSAQLDMIMLDCSIIFTRLQ
jgi:hypothetical protein